MKYVNLLRQRISLVAIALALACAAATGISMWPVASKNEPKPGKYSEDDVKQDLRKRAQAGVGNSVRFATPTASAAEVDASVESVASFIQERAGLSMSADTKKRLSQAEKDVLKGKVRRLGVGELTEALTDITLERLSLLTDQEIETAANISSSTADGEISSRESGKWGSLSKDEFISQLKAGREWSKHGDSALRLAVRPLVEEEVNERVKYLSESLPTQFGGVPADGATPTQVMMLAYSVAADDHLLGSQNDLEQEKILRRIAAKQTRADKKAQSKRESGKAYGPGGYLHSSPLHLLLNQDTVGRLISRMEGGKK